jgi:hypothetical protein
MLALTLIPYPGNADHTFHVNLEEVVPIHAVTSSMVHSTVMVGCAHGDPNAF